MDEKGAITSFFARRPTDSDELGGVDGERGARRRLRQGGSADNSSDSDTSDEEVEGEEVHSSGDEDAAGADAASDEDGEVKLLRRAPAPVAAKRRRLADSDDEMERQEGPQSLKAVKPVGGKSAQDDAEEEFTFRPSARAVAYTSV